MIAAALLIREIFGTGCPVLDYCLLAHVGGVAPYARFVSMQEFGQRLAIVYIRRRGYDRMDQPALTIDSDVSLHPEIPLVAPLCRMHFRVAFLGFVFRRSRRMDDRGVNDRSATNRYARAG